MSQKFPSDLRPGDTAYFVDKKGKIRTIIIGDTSFRTLGCFAVKPQFEHDLPDNFQLLVPVDSLHHTGDMRKKK
jgi:hypothetical protein